MIYKFFLLRLCFIYNIQKYVWSDICDTPLVCDHWFGKIFTLNNAMYFVYSKMRITSLNFVNKTVVGSFYSKIKFVPK